MNLNPVIEAFRRVIPSRHKISPQGWTQFNCPACGDRRTPGRGGYKETASGGFRYRCQNGGCEYERRTGWEPTNGFFGRAKRLFVMLGGDVMDIPREMRQSRHFERDATADLEVITSFPEKSMPEGSTILWLITNNQDMRDAQRYVLKRGVFFIHHPFFWSPVYPRHVIQPCGHHNKVIGWIARKIDPGKDMRHVKCSGFPSDFMMNQEHAYERSLCIVQEGAFDAAALKSLCTFGNQVRPKQENFLNQVKASGRKVVLVPDAQKQEWIPYVDCAEKNGWYLSTPK